MRSFDNITAVITGASSGIGQEMAIQLAPLAKCLILVARRRDRLEALKEELLIINPDLLVELYSVDFADEEAVEEFAETLQQRTVKVQLLINNAGSGDRGLFENSSWNKTRGMLETNIKALTKLTHALLPDMLRANYGAILNVSSVAGLVPVSGMAVYAASKSYVTSFSEALRAELRDTGVKVCTLCPGPVKTEFGTIAQRTHELETADSAPGFLYMPLETVAREGLLMVLHDRARVVPGLPMAILITLVSLLPLFILRRILENRARMWE